MCGTPKRFPDQKSPQALRSDRRISLWNAFSAGEGGAEVVIDTKEGALNGDDSPRELLAELEP